MTPNPHRGSDFADFLAEEGLMIPTMTPTKDLADALRFGLPMNPIEAVRVCNEAADRMEELEEQLAANHAAIKLMGKWLEDERALADRLAIALVQSMERLGVCAGHRKILDQWKEARSE
jgi:hypothetical protein